MTCNSIPLQFVGCRVTMIGFPLAFTPPEPPPCATTWWLDVAALDRTTLSPCPSDTARRRRSGAAVQPKPPSTERLVATVPAVTST